MNSLRVFYRSLSPARRNTIRQASAFSLKIAAYLIAPIKRARYRFSKLRSDKLHVGCGAVRLSGWVNADLDPRADLIVDITRKLPFAEDSLTRIYSEHVLEHLSVSDGLAFLRECHRVLTSGGVARIAMPDLDDLIEGYTGDWHRFDWLTWEGHEFIKTRAEMLNVAMRWWGHRYLYNREELARRLREAGFRHIQFVARGESIHSDLSGLETRADSNLVAEATK